MIDFSKVPNGTIDKEFILSKIDDSTIFYHYFGRFELKKVYRSVFTKDKNPSTGFYIDSKGTLRYSDFRTRENWNCFAFVCKLFNINYGQALDKIAQDFGLVESDVPVTVTRETLVEGAKVDKSAKEKTIIQVRPCKWTDEYLAFWRTYDVTKDELIKNNVFPVGELYINKNKIWNKNILRFAYLVRYKGEEYMKIYSPHDKQMKWVSNIPLSIPFGLETLEHKSDTVIVTKSMKDMIVVKKFHSDVIAVQNESRASLSDEIVELINNNYKNKYLWFDCDQPGINAINQFNDLEWNDICLDINNYKKYRIKDPSDHVSWFGVDDLINWIKSQNKIGIFS